MLLRLAVVLFIFLYISNYSVLADTFLVDHKVSIERVIRLDLNRKTLSLEVEIEQGKFGANVQESALAILSDLTGLPNFDDISILAENSEVVGKIEVARVRDNNHNIVGARRLWKLELPCISDRNYPFDQYSCSFKIVADKAKDEIDIRWASKDVPIFEGIDSFFLKPVRLTHCTHRRSVPSADSSIYTSEVHGCLQLTLVAQRPLHVAIFRFYLPTSLIMMLSWIVFYQKKDNVNTQYLIFFASVVLEVMVILNYLNSFPPPSVLSPADIWALIIAINLMIVVLFLFLISFSESANSKYRSLMTNSPNVRKDSQIRYQKKANKELLYDKDAEQAQLNNYLDVVGTVYKKKADSASLTALRIQIAGRALCPVIFIVCFMLYFILFWLARRAL